MINQISLFMLVECLKTGLFWRGNWFFSSWGRKRGCLKEKNVIIRLRDALLCSDFNLHFDIMVGGYVIVLVHRWKMEGVGGEKLNQTYANQPKSFKESKVNETRSIFSLLQSMTNFI
jgi:hypothetical protein